MARYEAPRLDLPWTEANPGGVVTTPGISETYQTGTWRTFRPVHDADQCIHCLACWIACPDSSILVENGKVVGIDYIHCKGCGICTTVCPKDIKEPHAVTGELGKVLQMIPESDATQD